MKKVLMTVLAVLYVAIMTGFFYMLMSDDHHFLPEKPVLYLYPQEERQLTVTLDLEGTLDTVYPAPDIQRTTERGTQASWTVTAAPDGTLTDQAGRTYPSLFWDGEMTLPDPDAGFVVSREDAVPFLEDKLAQLGLTPRGCRFHYLLGSADARLRVHVRVLRCECLHAARLLQLHGRGRGDGRA